jgi:antitoxin (DNA-binding transcriptional repressor) of toxin-antitoxin stability system
MGRHRRYAPTLDIPTVIGRSTDRPYRVNARENGRNGDLPAIMRSSIVLRMSTIDITLDEAALDLAGVVRRLREDGDLAILTDSGLPLAEIIPLTRSSVARTDELQLLNATESDELPDEQIGPRAVYSKRTGLPVVVARPGQRMVTSEEIYEELRGSGP